MILNNNISPKTMHIFAAWTALWAIVSVVVSITLWAMQFDQSAVLRAGMKAQSILLVGSSDEEIY